MTDTPEAAVDASETTELEMTAAETYAASLTERLGATGYSEEFDTVRVFVERDAWVETIVAASEELPFFSWLSAIDWSKTTEVGEGVDEPETLEERFEVICRLSSVENADGAIFVATVPKDDASIGSLTPHFGGAEWHEREAHEMFDIAFEGNKNLVPLYLPDDFIGHPLLKSYPLIAREVKPWPGDVDVEPMPDVASDSQDAEGSDT
ncbi:MAG: NADH-quinone oxidoreductase subunit C [Actinomycetia bacterium]|nr:NADH-quinone oxidoreductase subunit C [Actinomycetes bacterium]